MGALHAIWGLFAHLVRSVLAQRVVTWLDVLELSLPRFHFSGVVGVAFFLPIKSFNERTNENLGQFDKR
jgi:hypothetical protein